MQNTDQKKPVPNRHGWGSGRATNAVGLAIFYAGILLALEVVIRVSQIPSYILAPPSSIARVLYLRILDGSLLSDTAVTLTEILLGYCIAVVFGIVMGFLISEFRFFERAVYPLFAAVQSLPKIAIAPLILIWVGFGMEAKVTIAALVAFFPILVNTVTGLRAYDRDMLELFHSLSASRMQLLFHLKLPIAVPYLMAGLDVAFTFALLGTVIGEFLGATSGLGYAIFQHHAHLDTAAVFAYLSVLSLIGVLGHTIILRVGRRAAFWQGAQVQRG